MITVYKYPFPRSSGEFYLEMPVRSRILKVAMQEDTPYIWAMVNTAAPTKERRFVVVATGTDMGNLGLPAQARADFIETYFDGEHVLHLFELFV